MDLGAGSGKVFAVWVENGRIRLREHYRFSNHPVAIGSRLLNDVVYLYDQAKTGLVAAAVAEAGLDSVGIDSWGNDYGLLDRRGELIGIPRNYRDMRTLDYEKHYPIPFRQHYEITGIPCVRTTAYTQLLCEARAMDPRQIDEVDCFLMTPDLLASFMTGVQNCEYTETSTSSLVDARTRTWSEEVLATLPFRRSIFPEIVPPGTVIGPLQDPEMQIPQLRNTCFTKTAAHDTGSAVISAPLSSRESLYLSCGSMSLIGMEVSGYLINRQTYDGKYHNQGLPEGRMRIQRSIPGLWILQQCLKHWRIENPALSFSEVEKLAEAAEPFQSYVDVSVPELSQPVDMPERIRTYCRETGQPVPQTIGQVARCVYESLAVKYRSAAAELDDLAGRSFESICMMGGGTRDALLVRMLSDATGKVVRLGFHEASAVGNGLMQLIALGEISGLNEARKLAAQSISGRLQYPENTEVWASAHSRAAEIEKIYHERKEMKWK